MIPAPERCRQSGQKVTGRQPSATVRPGPNKTREGGGEERRKGRREGRKGKGRRKNNINYSVIKVEVTKSFYNYVYINYDTIKCLL